MNWSEIAPEGTAAWCNEWRKRYREQGFEEHQRDTDDILRAHPKQSGFDFGAILVAISQIDPGPIRVLEFGGWRGEMAAGVLDLHSHELLRARIDSWLNCEISSLAKEDVDCHDPRYYVHVPDSFLWETEKMKGPTFFVSSHSIEHLTKEHLGKLFDWLPSTIQHIWLQAPLPDDEENNKWENYGGTHILECGWKQVIEMLPDFELVYRGGIRNECLFFKRK